jgi:4-diphosphocytidyl-2C-methyl-D-erythritol kinase
LANFPAALNGRAGRARELVAQLQQRDLTVAGKHFYNSLEAPALDKFPVLRLYQDFLREHGASATLMSGSGSTTFALFANANQAGAALEKFKTHFGQDCWTACVPA